MGSSQGNQGGSNEFLNKSNPSQEQLKHQNSYGDAFGGDKNQTNRMAQVNNLRKKLITNI